MLGLIRFSVPLGLPVLSPGWTQSLCPARALAPGRGEKPFPGVCSMPEMICVVVEVWPTPPWKPLPPGWFVLSTFADWLTVSESLSFFFLPSLLPLGPQVAVEYQGPIFRHVPLSVWLLLTAPADTEFFLSPDLPHPNPSPSSCFQSGDTVFSSFAEQG